MSRVPLFVKGAEEVEGTANLVAVLRSVEFRLKDLLESERERLQKEVDYLREVHSGMTGGAAIEYSSTIMVDRFLSSSLAQFIGSD